MSSAEHLVGDLRRLTKEAQDKQTNDLATRAKNFIAKKCEDAARKGEWTTVVNSGDFREKIPMVIFYRIEAELRAETPELKCDSKFFEIDRWSFSLRWGP
jgi:hypothetical protein